MIELGHGFDDLTVEQLRDRTDADDSGRLERLHRLDECRDRCAVLRKRLLKFREILTRCDEQAIDIEEGVAPPRFVYIHASHGHGLAD